MEIGINFKYNFYKYYENGKMGVCIVPKVFPKHIIEKKTTAIYEAIDSFDKFIICKKLRCSIFGIHYYKYNFSNLIKINLFIMIVEFIKDRVKDFLRNGGLK